MDYSNLKTLTIPEGEATKITAGGVVLWEKVTSRIPSEYQEVEYIKAAAYVGAYLKLGFAFDTAAKIEIGLYFENTSSSYPFGAAENSGKYRCMITAPYDSEYYAYCYGSNGSTYLPCRIATVAKSLNDFVYTLKAGNVTFTNNKNTENDKTNISFTMTNELYLFAQNYNGTLRYGAIRQIHYFRYYNKSDTLICDLVPCYRKSDGVIGMYDIVRKIFLTNAGSGSFTKGADV